MKKKACQLSVEEMVEVNKSWDGYANVVRNHIANGTMPAVEACKLGLMIDQNAAGAKTAYIATSMLRLADDLIEFLSKNPNNSIPEEMVEALASAKKIALENHAKHIAEMAPRVQEELEAIASIGKAKDAEPAKGIFANVSFNDIINAKQIEGLPNN